MHRKQFFAAIAATVAIVLSGCSSAPTTPAKVETEAKKEPAKPAEAVAAQSAFYEMYKPARGWATDLLGLSLTSGEVPGIKNEDGKAGKWTAVFVSSSKKEARTFTYVVADDGDLRKGVNVGGPLVWMGSTPDSKAFSNTEFLVNSDAAYKAAYEKAAEWLKTHPGLKVTMALGNGSRFPAPVWYIMWGTKKEGYAVYVNATTGAVITK